MIAHPGIWVAIEKGIQYLREQAVLEILYDMNHCAWPVDPDEVVCTPAMRKQFLCAASPSCSSSLTVTVWALRDGQGQTLDELVILLQQYEVSLSSNVQVCVLAVEEPAQRFH